MTAAVAHVTSPRHATRGFDRVRAAAATFGAAVLGAAPHVLHHVGPLAGAALLAGATGKLVFGALGFLLAIPLLRRLHRRTGSWAAPGALLAVMAIAFSVTTFVVGPAITSGDDEPANSPAPAGSPAGKAGSGDEHESHHR